MNDCILSRKNNETTINFRTGKVYNAGLIVSAENGECKADCYFCGYIDGQVRLDVNENNMVKSILLPCTSSILEIANCALEIEVKTKGSDYVVIDGRVLKVDIHLESLLKTNGGTNYEG